MWMETLRYTQHIQKNCQWSVHWNERQRGGIVFPIAFQLQSKLLLDPGLQIQKLHQDSVAAVFIAVKLQFKQKKTCENWKEKAKNGVEKMYKYKYTFQVFHIISSYLLYRCFCTTFYTHFASQTNLDLRASNRSFLPSAAGISGASAALRCAVGRLFRFSQRSA